MSFQARKTLKKRKMMRMNSEGICTQESRITHLETISAKRDDEIQMLNNSLTVLNKELSLIKTSLVALESTFSTIKWLMGLCIALFGGIFVFLITELIKLI